MVDGKPDSSLELHSVKSEAEHSKRRNIEPKQHASFSLCIALCKGSVLFLEDNVCPLVGKLVVVELKSQEN